MTTEKRCATDQFLESFSRQSCCAVFPISRQTWNWGRDRDICNGQTIQINVWNSRHNKCSH